MGGTEAVTTGGGHQGEGGRGNVGVGELGEDVVGAHRRGMREVVGVEAVVAQVVGQDLVGGEVGGVRQPGELFAEQQQARLGAGE